MKPRYRRWPPNRLPPATWCALLLASGLMGTVLAQSQYHTPLRGSAERADLLDAIRPLAQWSFDAPIEFVVEDMRVAGDVAWVNVSAQRPGGAAIDLANSPLVIRDGETPALIDGPHLQALLRKSGRMWVSVQYAVGATDVWYSAAVFCPTWGPVLPEYCTGDSNK